MASTKGHDHKHGGPDDGADEAWFRVLDIAVWVSVAVITVLAAEWLIGHYVRESIANGAARHLKKVAPAGHDAE